MKKILLFCLALCLCLAGFAQQIRDIDMTVVLNRDGSARVTQIWDVNVVSGTEWYLPFDNLGPMRIDNLAVIDNGVVFASDGDHWDTDRTREEKRGRCGIVRKSSGGVELCWGQGDYGDHLWTVSYTVQGLVMRMGDYDGLYFTFVNPGLVAPAQHVRLRLFNETGGPAWTVDNTRVWGFRSDSEIFVEDGVIRAESKSPLSRTNAMTVLVRFDQGLFEPAVSYHKSFSDVQEQAFSGSDYSLKKKKTVWEVIKTVFAGLIALVLLACSPTGIVVIAILYWLVMFILYHVFGMKYKKSIYGQHKIKGWYRDVPLEGSIPAAYFTLSKGDLMKGEDFSKNLIGAYFLRWVLDGKVGVLPDPSGKGRVNLSFEQEASFPETVENDLYKMVREASGDNLILEDGEFEKWSKKSFKRVSDIPKREQTRGLKWYQDRHLMVKGEHCNENGQQQARHLIEFKNYLEDFTLSKERGAVEVGVWRDYLVFAALFGIADKVAKEFQRLYPGEFSQFSQTAGLDSTAIFDMMRISHNISATAMRNALAEKAARSSSSSGGSGRSWGGGGGFSMGGGGGSFGGSFGGGSR